MANESYEDRVNVSLGRDHIYVSPIKLYNKFVRTKMRLKEGTMIELQREISQNSLQVVYCRVSAGVLQVVYRLFAGFL